MSQRVCGTSMCSASKEEVLGFSCCAGRITVRGSQERCLLCAAGTEGCSGQKHDIGNIRKTMFSKVRQRVLFLPHGIYAVSAYRVVQENQSKPLSVLGGSDSVKPLDFVELFLEQAEKCSICCCSLMKPVMSFSISCS